MSFYSILVLFGASLLSSTTVTVIAQDFRLPESIVPTHQYLRIQPFINGNQSVLGYTEMTLEVRNETNLIIFHMVDIVSLNETAKITSTPQFGSEEIEISSQVYNPVYSFYIATLVVPLQAGVTYKFSMEYLGTISSSLLGFYHSQYNKKVNGTDEEVAFALTQFAPTEARRAFPCFDEPQIKAKYTVEVMREESQLSISNMVINETKLVSTSPDSVWYSDLYIESVPMSSYLVAWIVCDFSYLESNTSDVYFRVWLKESTLLDGSYSLGIAPDILTFYEQYFEQPFPMEKMDLVGVPAFYYGAMENWGAIFYKEEAFEYNSISSPASQKQRVCSINAHEIGHQWFGNLVTAQWWDDIWLNEGFASYLQYVGCNAVEPSFGYIGQFPIEEMYSVLDSDALDSARPVHQSVDTSNSTSIGGIYNAYTYDKGACLLRMMNSFLTEATFHQALINYLETFKYSTAQQDNLWQVMDDQAKLDGTLDPSLSIKTIMDTWTLQKGFPIINVKMNNNGTATITQDRFVSLINGNSTDSADYKWWIPLSWTAENAPDYTQLQPADWMTNEETEKTISGFPTDGSWILFNLRQTGYYRVNYDVQNWAKLSSQLSSDFTKISMENRAQLTNDGYTLAYEGLLSYNIMLDLATYMGNETDYVPIYAMYRKLDYLYKMLAPNASFENYLSSFAAPLYNSVGFLDSLSGPHLDQLKRAVVLEANCVLNEQDCVDQSVSLFAQWMSDPLNYYIISPNLLKTVHCTAIAHGGPEEWDFALTSYVKVQNSSVDVNVKNSLVIAMGCSRNETILSQFLNMTFDKAGYPIAPNDVNQAFTGVAKNIYGGEQLAWDYLRDNADVIGPFKGYFYVANLADIASKKFNTEEELNELNEFHDSLSPHLDNSSTTFDTAISRTERNIDWMGNYSDVIFTWLEDNGFTSRI